MKKTPKIGYLHPYIEGRRKEIETGEYPKSHLWGCDAIESQPDWDVSLIHSHKRYLPNFLESILNRTFFRGSPGLNLELSVLKASSEYDLIYSVCGPLALARRLKRAKIVPWVFQMPNQPSTSWFSPYKARNLRSNTAFCCLTPKSQERFAMYASSKFIPWCVDLSLFDGKPPIKKPDRPFFLATGKTGRDYSTLSKAAHEFNGEIRIIGPRDQKPTKLSSSIKWINTSDDPPDAAIAYPALRKWYAQCTGVCIPLSGDSDDTCGYTNMLEAMAMAKPILMTKSGSLHINPGERGYGMLINPNDPSDWAFSMNKLQNNHTLCEKMGKEGRRIVETEFTIGSFNDSIIKFLINILKINR
jgi:glycosyltransferase involved in cell wall biosynthesis